MKRLWAPWRSTYITSDKPDTCIFCSLPSGNHEKGLVLHKGEYASVIMNRFPYNNGHIMVSPLRHTARMEKLAPEESAEIFSLIQRSIIALKKSMKPHGFNVGMNLGKAAGAGIDDHLHMHVVPRWNGDANFMPVLSEVKIIPEHLFDTYRKLRPLFDDSL